MNKSILSFIFASLTAVAMASPGQSQVSVTIGGGGSGSPFGSDTITPSTIGGGNAATAGFDNAGNAASANNGGTYANSSADYGTYSSVPAQPTSQQTQNNQELNRSVQLPTTAYNLMAPKSVDMSSFPSGQFNYGFPNEATAPFMGVSRGSIGGFLPNTSTGSVNLNTVDCPFIRMPTEGNTGCGANPLGGININIPLGGGININANINPQNAVNSVQNWFSQ